MLDSARMKRSIKAPIVVTRGVVSAPETANAAIAAQEEEQRQRALEKQQRREEQEERERVAAAAEKQRQKEALQAQQRQKPQGNPPGQSTSAKRKYPSQTTHAPTSGRFESAREIQFYQARVGQQIEVVLLFGQTFAGEFLWRDTCNICVEVDGDQPRLINKNCIGYVRPLEALRPPAPQQKEAPVP